MKLVSALFLMLALVPLRLTAQTGVSNARQSFGVAGMEGLGTTKTTTIELPGVCPMGLRAQHMADGSMVKTGRAAQHGIGQRLRLTLVDKPDRRAVSAKILVRGWTQKSRLEQTSPSTKQSDASRGVRALTARFTAGENNTASAEIWVPALTAVDSVEMLSVSYVDGSTWTPGKDQACRIAPDLLMAVVNP